MKAFAAKHGLTCPYVIDETQALGLKASRATYSQ
jgi:hypothetical protein